MGTTTAGPGEKLGRAPRSNNSPPEDDEQTELERELASSGRGRVTQSADDLRKPRVDGSAVAPTEKAAEREQERHAQEALAGRRAAGIGGRARDERGSEATREALDEAGREADRKVDGAETDSRGVGKGDKQ